MHTQQNSKPVYKQKRFYFGMALVAFVLIIMAPSGEDKTTQTSVKASTETPVNTPTEYREVFKFSGNGVKQSEPFTIYGERFKIAYKCDGEPELTLCQAYVHEVGSGLPQLVMNSSESITDETILYGQGLYYIESNVIGDFTMTVYDYN